MNLTKYGLKDTIRNKYGNIENLFLARVTKQSKNIYTVISEGKEEYYASISGKLSHEIKDKAELPAVGDFVLVDRIDGKNGNGVIHEIVPRTSQVKRVAAGKKPDTQVIAANIDKIFICMALNSDFNIRRLERYITIGWDSGAVPVILLTKKDLCENLGEKFNEVSKIALGIDVLAVSAVDEDGYNAVLKHLINGETVVFIGSSGIGKSTLINYFLGREELSVNGLRDDDKGRHTTTFRQMFLLPNGCIVIDTPGMREVKIDAEGFNSTFEDIEMLSKNCRFSDCKHLNEPACAVLEAIDNGDIEKERLLSYFKLQKELRFIKNKEKRAEIAANKAVRKKK